MMPEYEIIVSTQTAKAHCLLGTQADGLLRIAVLEEEHPVYQQLIQSLGFLDTLVSQKNTVQTSHAVVLT